MEERKQLCLARHTARQDGQMRRHAKARAWRQIHQARAAAERGWHNAYEELASDVLVVAADLSRCGNHQAAMQLLQRVINTIPSDTDASQMLERIYARAPQCRSLEDADNDAYTQECDENGCWTFDFGPSLSRWISHLHEASAACCATCDQCAAEATCACGDKCQCGKSKCACGENCQCCKTKCACGDKCQCKKRKKKKTGGNVEIRRGWMDMGGSFFLANVSGSAVASQVAQTDNSEVQDITVIWYDANGDSTVRQYEVTRTLSADGRSVTRTERFSGRPGRFVHYTCCDRDGLFLQDMHDFVPCEE
jgi:hypothetical protein